MTPEQKAREAIDQRLIQAGWILQDMRQLNPMAGPGVAVREFPTSTGPVDYALFVDGIPVGVVEAKADEKGENITTVEGQSSRYAGSTFKWVKAGYRIRFAYEATGKLTRFTDYNDQKYRSRRIFSFHRPESLRALLKSEDTIRNNMKHFPHFDTMGFRSCQITAIESLEQSFAQNRPRALIQMATGAGKTFTAITAVYRLLKYAKINRVLFLVDTKGLGEQAEREFLAYRPNDDNRSFPEIYGVRRLKSSYIPQDVQVCISTIQRMYSILKGEELDESAEETSFNELTSADRQAAKEVVYNEKYPPEFFDCIIIDECHRSIYNVWQQVLDYFDAFLIGLTATPDKRTFAFFNENVVSEYSREQAIIDGVNVGEDMTGSAGQKRVPPKYLASCEIPVPPVPEQERIVSKIEEMFSKLEASVAELQTAKEKLKVYRQAVLEESLPYDSFGAISQYIESMGQGWSPKCANKNTIDDDVWAVIKTTAVQHGYFDYTENKILPDNLEPRNQHEISVGDILITRAGPRSRCGVCCLVRKTKQRLLNCDKVYQIKPNRDKILPEYMEYVLNSPRFLLEINRCKTGGNDSGVNLTQSRFLTIKIPVPSVDIQKKIVEQIESRLSMCDSIECTIDTSLRQAEALRQSILKQAFEGRL